VVTATFTDPLSQVLEQKDPAGFVTYAVESQNLNLRSAGLSNQIQIPLAPTLPPPGGLEAQLTSEGVVLTWEGELPTHQDPGVSYLYRVYRREKASKAVSLAGEVAVSIAAQPRFLDNGFEWQKTYEYWVAVTSVVSRSLKAVLQVEGENSPVVTIFANDTYPPAAPVGLQAVASGVGQKPFIDLAWAPNTEPDLAGYNVYGREGDGAWNKMNDRPLTTPTFRDSRVISGKTYSYAISAIDPRGNESPRSEETTETIP
jgi:hypothetical protein